jgi:sortase A
VVRGTLHFVSSVLIVSGVLMVSDALTTVVWQEPLSAFLAGRQQAKLEDAFARPPSRVVLKRPLEGDAIGRIELPSIGRNAYVIEGTRTGDLRKGPGHYADTPLPGEPGTVAIAGHRTTFGAPFRKIDKLRKGDLIRLQMSYGTFTYAVEKNRIVDPGETSVKRRVSYDRLVLTACHPLYSAAQRIVTFARLVRRDDRSSVTKG